MFDDDAGPQPATPLTGDLAVDAAGLPWPRLLAAAVIRQAVIDAQSVQVRVRRSALVFFDRDCADLARWCTIAGLNAAVVLARLHEQVDVARLVAELPELPAPAVLPARTCAWCGGTFQPVNATHEYCKHECRRAAGWARRDARLESAEGEPVVTTEIVSSDESRVCLDCRQTFVWTASEQTFYFNRGLQPPKRCAVCRQARRAARAALDAPAPRRW
jgi:hypothetical protein